MAVRSAVPSDLFPLVFSFLRENKLLTVAREFTKATGVKDQDPNAASLLDIFKDWLNSSAAKKRKLRSNGPSVTKKNKKDSSSSYDSSSEDGEPVVKRSGGKSPTIAQKASNGKATESSSSSSSNSSDYDGSSPEKKSPAKKMQPLNSAVVKPAACTTKIPCTKGLLTKVKESSSSDDSSDSLEDEKATIKSKPKSGNASLTKLLVEENNALKKAESSSDSNCNSSSEEYESKSKFSSKSLEAKAMVKAVPTKPSRPKNVSSSSDEGTESHSSEDETPEKTRAKASTSKSLVTKAKSSLASTKRVKRSSGSNSSLSESEVKKKATSEKPPPKRPLPCPEQVFMSAKKILAAPKDSSSDSDASSTYKDDTCNPAMKHKAVAHGKSPASIAGTSPTVPMKSILPKKGPAGCSSTSDSSDEEEHKSKKAVPAKRVKLNSAKKAKSSSSDSSSDFETEREKKSVLFTSSERTAAVSSTKKKATKKDNLNNNSSHSEEEKSVGVKGSANTHRTATLKTKVPEKNEESSEESSSSEKQQVNVLSTGKSLKKWKTEVSSGNQKGKERTSDRKALAQTPNTFLKVKAKKSQSAEPFRRVRDEEIEVDFRVGNNSFDAKRGAKGDWGEKANNVLKFTKGKSFRHEKTKKKRGNYCGGEISTSIKSIKFDSE